MTGVVILNYNSWDLVQNLAINIAEMNIIDKVVIVDNASSDKSFLELKKLESSKIHIISSDKNNGYSSGNNIGIKYLLKDENCEYIFISNPDIIVKEDCFEQMISVMKNNPEYGMVGAIRTDKEGQFTQRQYWDKPNLKSEFLDCFTIYRHQQKQKQVYEIDNKNNRVLEVGVIPGCFFGAQRSVIEQIGLFDENTFLYYEENILAFKIERNGYKQGLVVNAQYIHAHVNKKRTSKDFYRSFKIMQKSRRYFQKKYINDSIVIRCLLSLCMMIQNIEMKLLSYIKAISKK